MTLPRKFRRFIPDPAVTRFFLENNPYVKNLKRDSWAVPNPTERKPKAHHEEIAELVRRALVQAGDIKDAEAKLREITKRASIVEALLYARTLPDSKGLPFVVFDEQGKEMGLLTV